MLFLQLTPNYFVSGAMLCSEASSILQKWFELVETLLGSFWVFFFGGGVEEGWAGEKGCKFQWWKKVEMCFFLCQLEIVIFVPVCGSLYASLYWSVYCRLVFSSIKKTFPMYKTSITLGVCLTNANLSSNFIFIDTSFHTRLLTEVYEYRWRQENSLLTYP